MPIGPAMFHPWGCWPSTSTAAMLYFILLPQISTLYGIYPLSGSHRGPSQVLHTQSISPFFLTTPGFHDPKKPLHHAYRYFSSNYVPASCCRSRHGYSRPQLHRCPYSLKQSQDLHHHRKQLHPHFCDRCHPATRY